MSEQINRWCRRPAISTRKLPEIDNCLLGSVSESSSLFLVWCSSPSPAMFHKGIFNLGEKGYKCDASDSGSDDDEDPSIFMDGMVPPATDEDMFNIINEGVAEKNQNQKKRPSKTTHGGSSKKKKGPAAPSDEHAPEISSEMALKKKEFVALPFSMLKT
ncbi:unnamed protein product [Linum trigynum]|uniref:Uncharacterized protein n=1 Tax=Linum trigynum TaxID=586398 RepID=A0AAV2DYB5_9ROSI